MRIKKSRLPGKKHAKRFKQSRRDVSDFEDQHKEANRRDNGGSLLGKAVEGKVDDGGKNAHHQYLRLRQPENKIVYKGDERKQAGRFKTINAEINANADQDGCRKTLKKFFEIHSILILNEFTIRTNTKQSHTHLGSDSLKR